ncbi:MAG TPA: hypothetical protein GXX58_06240, partial [Gelria sp.]|nr:hypothetical protein [Gelria sp.]
MKKIKIVALITLLCFICTIPAFAATDWGKEPKNYDVRVFVDNKDNEHERFTHACWEYEFVVFIVNKYSYIVILGL